MFNVLLDTQQVISVSGTFLQIQHSDAASVDIV